MKRSHGARSLTFGHVVPDPVAVAHGSRAHLRRSSPGSGSASTADHASTAGRRCSENQRGSCVRPRSHRSRGRAVRPERRRRRSPRLAGRGLERVCNAASGRQSYSTTDLMKPQGLSNRVAATAAPQRRSVRDAPNASEDGVVRVSEAIPLLPTDSAGRGATNHGACGSPPQKSS